MYKERRHGMLTRRVRAFAACSKVGGKADAVLSRTVILQRSALKPASERIQPVSPNLRSDAYCSLCT